MSTITTYPLNGIDYDAADVAAHESTRTSGVYSADEDYAVTAAGGLTVTVGAGRAWVHPSRWDGYSIVKREPDTLTLPLADGTRPRIDRIVLRYDAAAKKTSLLTLTGDPASSPTAPAITRTALTYDLCLAEIRRPAGSTEITTGQITDTRLDEDLCGVMSDGVTGLPTAQLLAEAQARIAAVEETASDSAAKAAASQSAAAQNQADAEAARDAAAASAEAAKASETNAGQSAEKAATSEGNAKASEDAAKASEEAAAESEAAAKASQEAAATSEANAEKYSKEAGAKAGTDKTLTVENAPADAKAVGDALNSIDLSWDAVQNKPEVFPPESHTHDDLYYKKAEIDQKVNYLAAMNENATQLVFSGSATVNASSGGSFSVPSTVNYIDFDSYKNIVRGGTAKGSQSYYFDGGGGSWKTGSFTITFSQSGTVSWTKLSTNPTYSISNDSSTYNVKGYHYITMADFAATQAALQSAQSDTDSLMVDQEYRLTLLELGVSE